MEMITMLEAKAQGLKRYFTGRACPTGHVSERFVSTRACTTCAAEKASAWKVSNPDKHSQQKRAWFAANPERAKDLKAASQKRNRATANERNRRYRLAHLELARARSEAWRVANPGKANAKAARRRTALLQRTPSWADHDAITGMYELAAVFRRTGLDVEVDHAIPLQGRTVSGLHVHDNLQLFNSTANKAKSNSFASF